MTASEYIHQQVPGRAPTALETREIIAWCREWAEDCFGDTSDLSDLQLLRGCDRFIDGGLEFVASDVRWYTEGRDA